MGGSASKKRNIIRILLLGLDGAGKTTLLYKITGGKSDVLGAPTVGFNAETIHWDKKTILNIWVCVCFWKFYVFIFIFILVRYTKYIK